MMAAGFSIRGGRQQSIDMLQYTTSPSKGPVSSFDVAFRMHMSGHAGASSDSGPASRSIGTIGHSADGVCREQRLE